jgi:hypothetical protein
LKRYTVQRGLGLHHMSSLRSISSTYAFWDSAWTAMSLPENNSAVLATSVTMCL